MSATRTGRPAFDSAPAGRKEPGGRCAGRYCLQPRWRCTDQHLAASVGLADKGHCFLLGSLGSEWTCGTSSGLALSCCSLRLPVLLGLVEAMDPVRFRETIGLPPFEEQRGEIAVLKSCSCTRRYSAGSRPSQVCPSTRASLSSESGGDGAALLFNVGTLLLAGGDPLSVYSPL